QYLAEDHTCKGVGECHPYREFEGMQPSREMQTSLASATGVSPWVSTTIPLLPITVSVRRTWPRWPKPVVDGGKLTTKTTTCLRPKATMSSITSVTASHISRRRCSASICWPSYCIQCWTGAMSNTHYFAKCWRDARRFLRTFEP